MSSLRLIVCLSLLIAANSFMAVESGEQQWSGNTKMMFDTMLSRTPWFVREKARAAMNAAIAEVCRQGIVTEQDMYEIVRRTTPSIFQSKSFAIIEEYKSV